GAGAGDETWAAPPAGPAGPPPVPPAPPEAAAGLFGRSPRRRKALIAGAIAVALIIGAIAMFGGGGKKASPKAAGEIFLQPAAAMGPNPYTPSVATATPTVTPTATPAGPQSPVPSATGGTVAVQGQSGATPGLYGGTRNQSSCDPQQMVTFLQQNPDKAGAWVRALNGDPTFKWSGGTQLSVAQIPDYVKELTPVVLREDTRVTNHGFLNGDPTTLQSVLQAGTAVLVDAYGVPRVRCACGNPLGPAIPVPEAPSYTGTAWPGFTPAAVIVVVPPPTVINVFTLVNIADPTQSFDRPARTNGPADTAPVPFATAAASPAATPSETTPSASSPATSPPPSPTPAGTPAQNVDATKEGAVSASSSFSSEFPPSLAIDGDPTTSWFSAGSSDGPFSTFTWKGARDDLITDVTITGNQQHANPAFRRGFGFATTTLEILAANGTVVFTQDMPGPNDQVGVLTFHPGVVGRSVRLRLHDHLNPTCGGFSGIHVGVSRPAAG
ncbi:MAG TPA: discoidin domain-containing protein, partial [Actinomycetota bacterium]